MLGNDTAPTRSAILQMRDEHAVLLEAYDFLDEKRLLLAAELLRQLAEYEDLLKQYDEVVQKAERMLVATIRRHGLQGAQVPNAMPAQTAVQTRPRDIRVQELAHNSQQVVKRHQQRLAQRHRDSLLCGR